MKKKDKKIIEKVKPSTVAIAVLISLLLFFVMLTTFMYGKSSPYDNKFLLASAKLIPFPAVVINGMNFITVREIAESVDSMDKFYKSKDYSSVGLRVDFTTDDGKKRFQIKTKELLNKAVEDKAIEIFAKEKKIVLSDEDVNQAVMDKIEEYGNKDDVERDLRENYGMTLDDFEKKIVKPSMLKEALMESIESENAVVNEQSKIKIESAFKELQSGANFSDVAKKYSQGSSASNGGDLGWVTQAQVIPELAVELFKDSKSELRIVESDLGFHIAEVIEKKKDNDQDVIRVRQIFVKKRGFVDWLNEELSNSSISVFLKGYRWNKESGTVDFSDPEMKKFEEEIGEKTQGDASMIF